MDLFVPTALSRLLRLFRGMAALCLAVSILAPEALALVSLSTACGKHCCRANAKSCCRHRQHSQGAPAVTAPACPANCATRALPSHPVSLAPVAVACQATPPLVRALPNTSGPTNALNTFRAFQLLERPPPRFAVLPNA